MKNELPSAGSVTKLSLGAFIILAFFVYLPAFVTTFGMMNDYDFMAFRGG